MTNVKAIWFGAPIHIPAINDNPRNALWVGLGCAAGQVVIGALTVDERNGVLYVEGKELDSDKAKAFVVTTAANTHVAKATNGGGNVIAIKLPGGSSWYCDSVPDKGQNKGK